MSILDEWRNRDVLVVGVKRDGWGWAWDVHQPVWWVRLWLWLRGGARPTHWKYGDRTPEEAYCHWRDML